MHVSFQLILIQECKRKLYARKKKTPTETHKKIHIFTYIQRNKNGSFAEIVLCHNPLRKKKTIHVNTLGKSNPGVI